MMKRELEATAAKPPKKKKIKNVDDDDANDGGDDVYEDYNAVCSSSSGIAVFIR